MLGFAGKHQGFSTKRGFGTYSDSSLNAFDEAARPGSTSNAH